MPNSSWRKNEVATRGLGSNGGGGVGDWRVGVGAEPG